MSENGARPWSILCPVLLPLMSPRLPRCYTTLPLALIGFCFFCSFASSIFALGRSEPSGDLLLSYPIDQSSGASLLLPTNVLAGISASPLTPNGLTGVRKPDELEVPGGHRGSYWPGGWPAADQASPNAYIEFTLSPQCGFEVSLDRLEFSLYSSTGIDGIAIQGPRHWDVYVTIKEPLVATTLWMTLGNMVSSAASFVGMGKSVGQDGKVYTKDLGEYKRDSKEGSLIDRVSLRSLRYLQIIRPGATISVRFYGYYSKGGRGGFYHVNESGSNILLYGSIRPMDTCELSDMPPALPVGIQPTVAYLTDGTWGHECGGREFASISNVARLRYDFKGLDAGEANYFRGVGNERDYKLEQVGRALDGRGASDIVENVYRQIVRNYNNGKTGIVIVGWSRGAAIAMEVASILYEKGIPNKSARGGYYILPKADCLVIDQLHLLDTVHSMGVPGSGVNAGYHDKVLPPNIQRAYHYLADVDNPPFGFKQTRPPNAQELMVCRDMGFVPSHGDVGGSTGSDCAKAVYQLLVKNINSNNKTLIVLPGEDVSRSNPYPIPVKVYSVENGLVSDEEASCKKAEAAFAAHYLNEYEEVDNMLAADVSILH